MKFSKALIRNFAQAVTDYDLIQENDRILIGFSGGKDSFAMIFLFDRFLKHSPKNFEILALNIGYGLDENLKAQEKILQENNINYKFLQTNIFDRAKGHIRENSSFCSFFSRQRRGELYLYAKAHGYNKVALAHHLDDAAESFFMNLFNNAKLRTMPPIYTTNDGSLQVIRPLIRTREAMCEFFALDNALPTIANEACPAFRTSIKQPYKRQETKLFLQNLAKDQKDLFTMLKTAFANIEPSTFLDKKFLK